MRERDRRGWALLTPTWLVLGIFFLAPLALMLVVSFRQRGAYGGLKPVEDLRGYLASGDFLANYARSLETIYLGIGWRSLWMALLTTTLGELLPESFGPEDLR